MSYRDTARQIAELRRIARESFEQVPASAAMPAAAAANGVVGVEAFRRVSYDDLPSHLKEQLRTDGTHNGPRRSDAEARELFEQGVNADARGSIDGVEAVVNDPTIDAMHIKPHHHGGSSDASNIVYGPESLNSRLRDTPMSEADIGEAEAYTLQVAEQATPGVTGDLTEVVGDTLETGALGGVLGGGIAVAHRVAQAQGFRDAGRHDLAELAEAQIAQDATNGAINGMVRGTSMAVTQAVLGANPLTAGIGLVAPDVVMLLSEKNTLSQAEYNQRAAGVVGKGALATVLVCAGPVGWLGLAGYSIVSAYGRANQQGAPALNRANG
ncbi:hypothetical protein KBY96_07850 [Cyanobium sp. ATX 6A2]|uniref:hypothetical protein n=1 Tax=Cyanobium sp. ATX 6A2 TaxID=2823700 RepID=UPI0020CD907E|nr:hypothetical protein [Cyanobium sp. ATX 6A2]MCP9887843.1 hypothetical protein [Cyanobium sp. ATX 6A2]